MTTTRRLEIATIYSVGEDRRGRTLALPSGRALAGLTLVVSMAWIYVTWYPVDRYLSRQMAKVVLNQPIWIDWSVLLPPPPADAANPGGPPRQAAPVKPDEAAVEAALTQSEAVLTKLTMVMYGWLAATTFVAGWLAMCGGAGLASVASSAPARRATRTLVLVCGVAAIGLGVWMWVRGRGKPPRGTELALALAVLVASGAFCIQASRGQARVALAGAAAALVGLVGLTWLRYDTGWPAIAARISILLIFVIATVLGVLLTRPVAQPRTAAAVFILVSSFVTLGAVWYASRQGGFLDNPPPPMSYLKLFGLQSSYAWILLAAKVLGR